MSGTAEYEVDFECSCASAVDVRTAINSVGSGPRIYSDVSLSSHHGTARLSAETAEEAMGMLRAAIEGAASAAGTTCDLRFGDARKVAGTR